MQQKEGTQQLSKSHRDIRLKRPPKLWRPLKNKLCRHHLILPLEASIY